MTTHRFEIEFTASDDVPPSEVREAVEVALVHGWKEQHDLANSVTMLEHRAEGREGTA